jgi:hypothetical protein
MKKLFLTAALASIVAFAGAQTLTTKAGNAILPEDGDWSISFDASPLGTIFRDSGPSALSSSFLDNFTIVGKMMTSSNTAFRAKLRIGSHSHKQDGFSDQTGSTTTPAATVTDTKKESSMNITLGGGIQKYRGKGRVQGYYGAEAYIMLGSSKTTYDYGNAITSAAPNPDRTDFGTNISFPGVYTTEDKGGSSFGFGVRGFIGAEYFFAEKMSFGFEYGWGPSISSTGEGEATAEYYDATTSGPKTSSGKTGGSSDFLIDVDNASGMVAFSLYF